MEQHLPLLAQLAVNLPVDLSPTPRPYDAFSDTCDSPAVPSSVEMTATGSFVTNQRGDPTSDEPSER
jgi:hypothetical protein